MGDRRRVPDFSEKDLKVKESLRVWREKEEELTDGNRGPKNV